MMMLTVRSVKEHSAQARLATKSIQAKNLVQWVILAWGFWINFFPLKLEFNCIFCLHIFKEIDDFLWAHNLPLKGYLGDFI